MYPQKVDDTLFFIQRKIEGESYCYSLVESPYPTIPTFSLQSDSVYEQMKLLKEEQQTKDVSLIQPEGIKTVIDLGSKTASFLHMVSLEEGYYIEHPRVVEKNDACIPFSYYRVYKEDGKWETKKLFSFSLPAHFIIGDSECRLYESLLPFLPRHTKRGILFTNCYDPRTLRTGIFKFVGEEEKVVPVSYDHHDDIIGDAFFSPLSIGPSVFYGGVLLPEDFSTGDRLPAIWINNDGFICVDLPIAVDDSPLLPHPQIT
jgi:hypothetical protein